MLLRRFWGFAVAARLVGAAPARPVSRDVSTDVLDQLTLFAQYAAASYCSNNLNSTGTPLLCAAGNCPSVQSAQTSTLHEFDHPTKFGDVAGFLAADKTNKLLVLSFRGSRTLSTWIANLDFGLTDASLCSDCQVHTGFWQSWQTVADEMRSKIDSALKTYSDYTLVFTGHSFGAAIATLGGTALRNAGYKVNLLITWQYTYGEPRVGNEALAKYITKQARLWRVTHTDDIVPKLPPASFGFSHASPEYWVTSGDNKTVTPADIQVVQGVGSTDGNAGTPEPDVSAHNWYLLNIDACQ